MPAIFIISSKETAEREWLDAAVRDEGIATAISEERNAADGHSQPGRLPDQIMKVADKTTHIVVSGLTVLKQRILGYFGSSVMKIYGLDSESALAHPQYILE